MSSVGQLTELIPSDRSRPRQRARLVIELADAGPQSAWETWVRYELLRAGLPRPTTQLPVQTDVGTFHTDLGYEQWVLGNEFDGRVKYRPGVRQERRRGDDRQVHPAPAAGDRRGGEEGPPPPADLTRDLAPNEFGRMG